MEEEAYGTDTAKNFLIACTGAGMTGAVAASAASIGATVVGELDMLQPPCRAQTLLPLSYGVLCMFLS